VTPPSLNPTPWQLLAVSPSWPSLILTVLLGAVYFWAFVRTPRLQWPGWKALLFSLGLLALLIATQTAAAGLNGRSMALYMGRMMVLAEVAPPLLVLGWPRRALQPRAGTPLGRLLGVLLDPWVALSLWATIIIFWNIPAGLNASLVSNTAARLLPALYLLGGLLSWGVVLRPLPGVQPAGIGSRGWFGLLSALPMMMVAAVWLYSPRVLYTPYVGALCLWNTTPLQNQTISGYVMMIAGLPAMFLAFGQLIGWLISLTEEHPTAADLPPE
jgi:cytochrome c oxidase assembly factor CtaG